MGVGPDPVVPGETFVYFIEITNTGSVSATILLTDVLPSELACASTDSVDGYEGGPEWFGYCSDGVVFVFSGDYIPPPAGPIGLIRTANPMAVSFISV